MAYFLVIAAGLLISQQLPVAEQPKPDAPAQSASLLSVRRVYVDRLNGGETAAQIRDMIINALHSARLFTITENPDRADTFLRGSGEDLVFTETFQSSDRLDARASLDQGSNYSKSGTGRRAASLSVGEDESTRIAERKHEASASVRLVTKDGDVIWSTTQESFGGKFLGASADVANKILKQLLADYRKASSARHGTERPDN